VKYRDDKIAKPAHRPDLPNGRERPGADVMITIFCDFSQFSAKKLAFFLNTNVMINFFQNLVKNAKFFANFFGENILKIITTVPGAVF
jgi:hypothetical protein